MLRQRQGRDRDIEPAETQRKKYRGSHSETKTQTGIRVRRGKEKGRTLMRFLEKLEFNSLKSLR